jgi:hypothetical protein
MVGRSVVLQQQDRDIVRQRVIVKTAGIDGHVVAQTTDQRCDFHAIPLQAASGKKADNSKRNSHCAPNERHSLQWERLGKTYTLQLMF